MFSNLKTLVVVMGIASAVFILLKPLALQFMAPEDYARRRNVWIALTVTAFLSPSFWLYSVVALAVLAWAAHKDSNPPALYVLMLHVIPPVGRYIPMVGINHLFELTNYRILALVVLVPFAWRLLHTPQDKGPAVRTWMDGLLFGFIVLQLALLYPFESFTNTMRRGFLLAIDVWVVYYAFSRGCRQRAAIVDVLAAYALACALFAPIALFESAKGWLLYQGLGFTWGTPLEFAYLMRGDMLRAQASVGHSLALGYMLAIAFGISLYLGGLLRSQRITVGMGVWLWVGLAAAYSRAPWLVALVAFFAYAALQPDGLTRFIKYSVVALVLAGLVVVSPVGERVIDSLPFIGTVDAASVEYRKRLAEVSWQLIQQNPWFGNPFVLTQMESLRQGQGIIDLVNSYASIALLYGLVGLGMFLGVFILGMVATYRVSRQWVDADPDLSLLGCCLLAITIATLFMMATGSFGTILAQTCWILMGLSAAYAGLRFTEAPVGAAPGWPAAVSPAGMRTGVFRTGQ